MGDVVAVSRIASLLPSATEIVYALGLDDRLAAVTFECDEPARARLDHRVVVTGADTSGWTPGEIDAYVRERRAAGVDLYTLDEGALADVEPDLVLTQDLCRVCALPTDRVDEALAHLGCSADVLTLDPHTLEDVLASVERVAAAAGVPGRGRDVVAGLRERLAAVAAAAQGRPRPRVAVVEWVDPLFTGGHWIPDQVAAAGGEPVGMHPGTPSGPSAWDGLRAERPDVVLVAPCGYGLDGAAEQAAVVRRELPDAQVWAIDGNAVVVRPGPRLVDGVEAMASVLHPDVVEPSLHVRRVP
ncbi:ABC transporter substrate-binding protein [Aeromicrobium sp. Leaf272]|uniref:ABC transporter substrate-binding protein n=1 Tax=Aeromicrobium sp. Leaf272 TaxID=1736317 RepID=UPI0006FD6F86|nr:ABC transporter substrate-binding protein [Aeromicrobium sp. Leaf272]KQP27016.1 ABC transporter substrate-binding protein [Aeromicrobium sp. Leaf272]